MSAKGNLEIHCGKNIVWSKGNDNADYLFFHNKLGLVLYDKNNKSLWKANDMWRRISAPMILIMQDDGNLVIYDRCRKPYWESRTYEKCKASSGLMDLVFPHLWRETVKLTNSRLSIFTPMTLILMNFTVVTFLIVHIHCLEKRIYLNVSLNLFC